MEEVAVRLRVGGGGSGFSVVDAVVAVFIRFGNGVRLVREGFEKPVERVGLGGSAGMVWSDISRRMLDKPIVALT